MVAKRKTLTVLIPALNEEKNIKKVIQSSKKIKNYDTKIIVVIDKKTTDRTAKVAKKLGAKIILGKGSGKGSNIKTSLSYLKSEFVVQIDADYQFMPYEIPKLVSPLTQGYDIALGTRYQKGSKRQEDSVSYFRLLGSIALSFITSIFSMQRITDVMAGFKAFKTQVLKDLNPKTSHFGYEAELVVRGAKKGYKIINVPITYKKRPSGKSSVSSIKDGFLVLLTIIKTFFEK